MSKTNKSSTSLDSLFDNNSGRSLKEYDLKPRLNYNEGKNTNSSSSLAMTPNSSVGGYYSSSNNNSITSSSNNLVSSGKNIIILVGLPATGKSTISKQLTTYMNRFTNYKTKIYNCGKVRREILNDINQNDSDSFEQQKSTPKGFHSYEFFDPNNEVFKFKRELIAMQSLNKIIDDLHCNTINLGVLDATNTTQERRTNLIRLIQNKIDSQELVLNNLIILDIQCNDEVLIKYNINAKTNNEDYRNYDVNKSIEDFTKRLENYNKAYQPITSEELMTYKLSSYILIQNGGELYNFQNFTKSDLIAILERFFINYSNYDTKLYHQKVQEFLELVNNRDS